MKLAQMDAELDQDPDMDFFGEELMQELVHKPSAEEKRQLIKYWDMLLKWLPEMY